MRELEAGPLHHKELLIICYDLLTQCTQAAAAEISRACQVAPSQCQCQWPNRKRDDRDLAALNNDDGRKKQQQQHQQQPQQKQQQEQQQLKQQQQQKQ
mmetsp:Transcript_29613/g.47569  ORF Transcript_29613/g.47569 Transcript_29613/m.47569 type:complete len:98 (-) Transcript_29613:44-337(-)